MTAKKDCNRLPLDDRRLIRALWAERAAVRAEMDRIRIDAEERIAVLSRQARQLTQESLARKFECSIAQIHNITRYE